MKKYLSPLKKMGKIINTRLGFVLVLLFFYWIKSLWAYSVDFNLDLENTAQTIVAIFNPLPLGLLLLGFLSTSKRVRFFIP